TQRDALAVRELDYAQSTEPIPHVAVSGAVRLNPLDDLPVVADHYRARLQPRRLNHLAKCAVHDLMATDFAPFDIGVELLDGLDGCGRPLDAPRALIECGVRHACRI